MAAGISVGSLYASLALDKSKFEIDVKRSKGLFGSLADVAKKSALIVGAALVGMAAGAAKMATSYKEGVDAIRAGTGATGADLDALTADFDAVAKKVPEDLGLVGQVLADVNTRTGQTGEGLQDLTKLILDLSRVTGTDAVANVANITRMFGDWSVATEDQSAQMDKLLRASQTSGIGVDTLTQKVAQFGSPMRLMGFTLDESVALLGKWEKEGVNTEAILGALKIGVGKFAQEGLSGAEGMAQFIAKVEKLGPGAKATTLAIETFGSRAGPDMVAAVLEGRFAIEDYIDAIANGSDTIASVADDTRDFGQVASQAMNIATVAVGKRLLPVLTSMLDWAMANMPQIEAVMDSVFTAIGDVIGWVVKNVVPPLIEVFRFVADTAIPALQSSFKTVSDDVVPTLGDAFRVITDEIVPAVGAVFGWLADNVLPPLMSLFETFSSQVLPVLQKAFAFVVDWVVANWPLISEVVGQIADALSEAFGIMAAVIGKFSEIVWPIISAIADVLLPMIGAAASLVLEVVRTAFALIGGIWDTAKGVAQGVADAIVGSFDGMAKGIGGAWDGATKLFKGALNFIIGLVNNFLRFWNSIQISVPSVDVPLVGVVGGFSVGVPKIPLIPKLATGLPFVPTTMLAELHPGEAVLRRDQAEAWRAGGGAGGLTVGSLNVTVSDVGSDVSPAAARRFGQAIADEVAVALRSQSSRLGRATG